LCLQVPRVISATIDGVEHDLAGRATEEIVDLGIALVPRGRRFSRGSRWRRTSCLGAYRPKARAAISRNQDSALRCSRALPSGEKQLAGSMSGGEQQMLTLARALYDRAQDPPHRRASVGLAPILVIQTIDKIRELKESYRLTVLMAEQNSTRRSASPTAAM